MKKFVILITLALFLTIAVPAQAITNPLEVPNNKFGIHIMNEHDLESAANLVNSSGGQWGYVTIVIREDEMDQTRWQNFMNMAKEKRLIPIVRLATKIEEDHWQKPSPNKANDWATFLNSLTWPTLNRYVILFNEPNHATEWGGSISPEEYSSLARTYWEQLKRASDNFFVLPAALDLAAPNGPETIEAQTFYQRMFATDPLIFTIFDGLASHSYPNPHFCGVPGDTGQMSLRGFEWELETLQKYDLLPNSPVFITETGWSCPLSSEVLSSYYQEAFNSAWNNPRIVAITPFILDYDNLPFRPFSWLSQGKPLPLYSAVQSLPKNEGQPKI